MELRQLEHFVAVAEECHFTRAAARVRIAQSALSASIRSLERELRAELFTRSTRRVALTEAGRALLAEAHQVLAAAEAARDSVASVQGLLRGRLRIGVLQSMRGLDLPPVLAEFRAAHPGVELLMRHSSTTGLADMVREGALDVAFVGLPHPPPDLEMVPLLSRRLMVACAPGHRFARLDAVRLADLADEVLVDFPPGWGIRLMLDEAFAAAGLTRRTGMEVGDVTLMLELAAQGLGPAVMGAGLHHTEPDVRFVPLVEPELTFTITAALPRGHTPSAAARTLVDMLLRRNDASPER
ncbi:LysR family transcriptional regulator [Spirillospora sp. CA-294931]|uniref:LysR family transcriptional regulator n=1 Tax=Spirillospora sp. CA-294931 TaxID=3240042 RepID=UPI003D944ECC